RSCRESVRTAGSTAPPPADWVPASGSTNTSPSMPDHLWWYLSRASGIVTLTASGGAIVWGLLLSTRLIRRRSLPRWLLDLHRFLGAVAVLSLGVHLAALWADSYVHFSVADLTVPGHTTWHPVAVAWGIVAAYLLVAVELS